MNPDTSDDTVELVAGTRLQILGRLGLSMIEAQRRLDIAAPADPSERQFVTVCREAARCAREWVAARELVLLARQGMQARADLRRDRHKPITGEYQAAVIAQRRWTAAAAAAMDHEQESLPGMGGEEGGGPA